MKNMCEFYKTPFTCGLEDGTCISSSSTMTKSMYTMYGKVQRLYYRITSIKK